MLDRAASLPPASQRSQAAVTTDDIVTCKPVLHDLAVFVALRELDGARHAHAVHRRMALQVLLRDGLAAEELRGRILCVTALRPGVVDTQSCKRRYKRARAR